MGEIELPENRSYLALPYFQLEELLEFLRAHDRAGITKIRFVNPHSFRGYYDALAFEVLDETGTIGEMVDLVQSCLGKTFEGYKGGNFKMQEFTDVWLANCGSGGGQKIGLLLMEFIVGER